MAALKVAAIEDRAGLLRKQTSPCVPPLFAFWTESQS